MTARASLAAERRAVVRVLERLRHAPISSARKFAEQLRAELDAMFPPARSDDG